MESKIKMFEFDVRWDRLIIHITCDVKIMGTSAYAAVIESAWVECVYYVDANFNKLMLNDDNIGDVYTAWVLSELKKDESDFADRFFDDLSLEVDKYGLVAEFS